MNDAEYTYEEALQAFADAVEMEGLGYAIQNGYVDEYILPVLDERAQELFDAIQQVRANLNYIDSVLNPYYP